MAFLGHDDFLVLEKASGQVRRVRDGQIQETVLDLAEQDRRRQHDR